MDAAEVRMDQTTGDMVLISSARSRRPTDFSIRKEAHNSQADTCPFCPGNEDMTPPETYRIDDAEGKWIARIVPNLYPAVEGMGAAHEVVIENEPHGRLLWEYDTSGLTAVLSASFDRCRQMYEMPGVRYVQLFRNHGKRAGASLYHNHSQIIALPFVPPRITRELEYTYGKDCPWCAMLDTNVLAENRGFRAVLPPWGRFPYETWIIPVEHGPDMLALEDITALTDILKKVMKALFTLFPNLPYTMHFHSIHASAQNRHYHWHLEITPYLTTPAGFERATDTFINPLPPEDALTALLKTERHSGKTKY